MSEQPVEPQPDRPTSPPPPRPAPLLNRAAVRRHILSELADLRPQLSIQITRVADAAYDKLETRLRAVIRAEIMEHPSKGSTFNP